MGWLKRLFQGGDDDTGMPTSAPEPSAEDTGMETPAELPEEGMGEEEATEEEIGE